MRNAIAPPIQSHGLANTRRCGVNSRPKTIPAPKISMEYLFSRPNPASMPNQIQSFWSPVLTMRISHPRAAHPEQRLECVHRQEAWVARMPGATSVARAARPGQRACRRVRERSERRGRPRTLQPRRATSGSPAANRRSPTAPSTRSTRSAAAGRRNPNPNGGCTPGNTTRRENSCNAIRVPIGQNPTRREAEDHSSGRERQKALAAGAGSAVYEGLM